MSKKEQKFNFFLMLVLTYRKMLCNIASNINPMSNVFLTSLIAKTHTVF